MNDTVLKIVPDDIRVCFENYSDGDFSGTIYSIYEKDDLIFQSIDDIIPIIMDHLDMLGRPVSSETFRSFKKKKSVTDTVVDSKNGKVTEPMRDKDEIKTKRGDIGTFVVHVKYRQNASMQGEVVWTETGDKKSFRSAYELLKLMDSAMQPDDQEDETE
jgi:hypothetical protein